MTRGFVPLTIVLAAIAIAATDMAAQGRGSRSAESLPATTRPAGVARSVPPQPAATAQSDVSVRAELDRTAIWIADRLTYTFEITCRRGIDLLVDDLSRDKLKLEGLEVIDADTTRHAESDDVTRYVFRYLLTTYRTDVPTLRIAPLSVRYAVTRPGQRAEDATPAGAVQVPGAAVAFRSLLPDDQPSYPVRDDRAPVPRWIGYRILQSVGLGLIILSFAPVALVVVAVARRMREQRRSVVRQSARQARQDARALLDAVRSADPASPEARRAAFTQLDALVRRHLSDISGVNTPGLTPEEIGAALEPRRSRIPVELVTSVLTACELARYAPLDRLPAADSWRDTLAQAEQVLASGR